MENKLLECECGKIHEINTKNIVVNESAFSELLNMLKARKDIKSAVIFNSLHEEKFVIKIKETLLANCIKVNQINYIYAMATISNVENIKDFNQEVVIAIGSEEVISLAKYYAYMFSSELIIFPVGNFTDWTFSKYARLYDGITFDFYSTVEPSYIYVSTVINKKNDLQYFYVVSKYISLFDLLVREHVYQRNVCKKIKNFLKQSLNNFLNKRSEKSDINLRTIWFLIRLGQGMSFFSQTKMFFGGDKQVLDIIQAQNPSSCFLELEIIALKLTINLYGCFYKKYPVKSNVNLNKHIKSICSLLNLSQITVLKKLTDSKFLVGDDVVFSRFSNYYPYLSGVLENIKNRIYKLQSNNNLKLNYLKKYNFTHKRLEQSFAVSPCFCSEPTSLNLFLAFGYMDKLL